MADFENFAELIAKYNSTLPTLSDGQASQLQVDANGRLLVQANVTVDISAADGDSVIISDGTNDLAIDASGYITVNQGTSPWVVSADGGSFAVTQSGTWTVDAAQSGAWSVTADTELSTDDLDTGAGTDTQAIVGLALAEDGGHVLVGSANPLPISGSVSISGTVGVTQSTSPWVVSATDLDIRNLAASQDNVAISDGTDTLAVNGDGSLNVVATATDLDIRNLSASQDNVAISDGTDTLAVNADGSINVNIGSAFTENDVASDPTGDGIVALTAGPDVIVSQAVGAGQTFRIHGWNWGSDRQCIFRLEVYDGASLVEILRVVLNSGAQPSDSMGFGEPIQIAGAATRVVRVSATRLEGSGGSAAAAINATLD